ncbi:MAG: methyltransferase domain-containing protein [Rhizobiales bacterium]|nr:methyltransferase domain-containing protein [Hyphomicrobiales bacterium]
MASPAPRLFDHEMLKTRQYRAVKLEPELFLADRIAEDMAERLDVVKRNFVGVADIGSPGMALRQPSDEKFAGIRTLYNLHEAVDEVFPLEPESLELVVSSLVLQFINDLPGVLAQIKRALKADGLFIAALVGGETLTELRQSFAAAESEIEGGVSPRVFPFIDLRDAGALLQRAGFALPVTDLDRIIVRYDNAFALMHDLRRMGATNILIERSRKPLRRTTLLRMVEIYRDKFSDPDGRIRATFDIVWMSGWAPHGSQQKPLKPSSAKASLADAVKGTKKS